MHEAHLQYVKQLREPAKQTLNRLFALLDEFDATDRDFLLGHVYLTFYFRDLDDRSDTAVRGRYERFKDHCVGLNNNRLVDQSFLVPAVVGYVLAAMAHHADESQLESWRLGTVESADAIMAEKKTGSVPTQRANRMIDSHLEHIDALRAQVAYASKLYEQFCERVVRRLL